MILPCLLWAKISFNSTMRGSGENKHSVGLTRRFPYASETRTELIIHSKSPLVDQKGPPCGRSIKLTPALYNLFTQQAWFKIVRLFFLNTFIHSSWMVTVVLCTQISRNRSRNKRSYYPLSKTKQNSLFCSGNNHRHSNLLSSTGACRCDLKWLSSKQM